MANRLVLSTLLGGIVLFVWSAIAWMVIPWPGDPLRSFTNEDAVLQAVTANAPRSGNYLLPNEPKRAPGMTDEQYKAASQATMDRMTRGPMVFTVVRLEPMGSMAAAEKYVEEMFSGKKEHLRPVYDALLKLGLSMGKDTKACPCQTIVPLYRKHVFAQIKPTTQTRIDFGLALGDNKTPKRLIDTGGFAKKDRITHRFEITSEKDIDAEVKRWLKEAYDRDA